MSTTNPYGPLPSARIGPHVTPVQPGRAAGQREVGLPATAAVALLIALSALGGAYDLATGTGLRRVYGISFVLGCVLAAALVRYSHRLVPVFAPALVFAATAVLGSLNTGRGDLIRTASDVTIRLIEPGKAFWLLGGTALAAAIAVFRTLRHRAGSSRHSGR
ncbi:MAG: hypothetical protein JWL64_2003 [Frankiales bacterium]|nr:hypothetical protein [Frankiales bacterium]